MKKLLLLFVPLVFFLSCEKDESSNNSNVSWKGYSYSTVQIGDQLWFAENCRYLPSVSPSKEISLTEPHCYVYGYEGTVIMQAQSHENYNTYGALYNRTAVLQLDRICPPGWHIPSDEDWNQLTDYLGGADVARGKMKESGYEHWGKDNTGGSNSSGFTALPAGYTVGYFDGEGWVAVWWSSSNTDSDNSSWKRNVYSNSTELIRKDHSGEYGFSCRCIKD